MLRILVVIGTVRSGRKTEKLAALMMEELAKRENVEPVLLDIAALELPIMTERYKFLPENERPEGLEKWREEVLKVDGIVLCVPEYNSGYPGALKNVLDSLYTEYKRKPFGIVAVSAGFSGQSMVGQLRNVISGLGSFAVPVTFRALQAAQAWNEKGELVNERYIKGANSLIDDVLFYTEAVQNQLKKATG